MVRINKLFTCVYTLALFFKNDTRSKCAMSYKYTMSYYKSPLSFSIFIDVDIFHETAH